MLFRLFISSFIGFAGIEDKENWHGKPLGGKISENLFARVGVKFTEFFFPLDKADEILKNLQGQLHSQNRTTFKPNPITTSVPDAKLVGVKLSEPPNYKLGDKVSSEFR